mgnify:CR=1 FL=1|tara:strand:+ start:1189 stop:1404 length:216 start_codon:yes stop_codon:yes gene_type:complete
MTDQENQTDDLLENLNDNAEYYNALRLFVESLETDVLKSNKGNKAAGVRLRKSLRRLKQFSADFVKFTLKD